MGSTGAGSRGTGFPAAARLLPKAQALGGWNGGAEEIPERAAVDEIDDSEFKLGPAASVAGRVTTASGLGAQAGERAQSGEGVGA
jgi:hypothetical protein